MNAVTDRALGSLTSAAANSAFGLVLTNATEATLNQIVISLDDEQWRYGGRAGITDKIQFSYSVGATSVNAGTFASLTALDVQAR